MANRFTKKPVQLPKTKKSNVNVAKATSKQTKKIFRAQKTEAEKGSKKSFGGAS